MTEVLADRSLAAVGESILVEVDCPSGPARIEHLRGDLAASAGRCGFDRSPLDATGRR